MTATAALDQSIGVLYIGVLLSAALWGVSCSQAWTYWRSSPRDPRWVKTLVGIVTAIDTTHQALISHLLYTYLISNFGDTVFIETVVKTLPVSVPILQMTATLVQGFYAWRIWKLSHGSLILTGLVIVLDIGQTAVAIIYTVRTFSCRTFPELNERMGPMMLAYSTIDMVADIFITVTMCLLLRSHRSRSRNKITNTVINKLVYFVLTTGFLTSVCALGIFVSFVAEPDGTVYLFFFFIIGRLYFNSLLASLNMRSSLRADAGMSEASDRPHSGYAMEPTASSHDGGRSFGRKRALSESQVAIRVHTIREYMVDTIQSPISPDSINKIERGIAI